MLISTFKFYLKHYPSVYLSLHNGHSSNLTIENWAIFLHSFFYARKSPISILVILLAVPANWSYLWFTEDKTGTVYTTEWGTQSQVSEVQMTFQKLSVNHEFLTKYRHVCFWHLILKHAQICFSSPSPTMVWFLHINEK